MFSKGLERRSVTAIAVAALTAGVGVGAVAYSTAAAAPTPMIRLEISATALKPAVRLNQVGVIMFPMNPSPRCGLSRTSFGQARVDHTHQGVDIMATLGQEVYAADNGVLYRQSIAGEVNAESSGNSWHLRLTDRTYFFYGHLSSFAPGLKLNDTVVRGQLIGYVGDTGNADDLGPGNYHLHFEVHPKGGLAVNPFPLLTIPKACTIWA